MTSNGYNTGKSLGQHWKKIWLGIAVLIALVYGWSWLKQAALDRKAETEAITRAAQRDASRARDRESCTATPSPRLLIAQKAIDSGDADAAVLQLKSCQEYGLTAEVSAMLASATRAADEQREVRLKKQRANQVAAERQARLVDAADKARRRREGVSVGMSPEEVLASSWGKPRKINRTTGANYAHEQWVYDGGYLYFREGRLTTIQN